ncbi:hypothetical protein [Corynebacterium nasicanis]|uniref:Anti-sigma-D factor RsdA sigma factor binding region domain-containing protein n=1 Tax=Corynebacterium nasicanis TaxID=1448267 RepID=A0ABW1QF94_9CORY
MKRRHRDANEGDITSQLAPLVEDDAFLTALSEGVDPTDGADELAALFLELRADVEKQMPPAPLIEGADEEPVVISLASRRRRGARSGRPFVSGLLGAAAATLVIAGSGSLLYNATPDSPLWGLSSTLFSDRAAVVQLAGTLEEIDSRAAEGDMDGTRALLEEARRMVSNLKDSQEEEATRETPRSPGTTATTTVTRPTTAPQTTESVTETVTETAHHTETSTVTVTQGPPPVRENPLPTPSEPVPLPSDPLPGNPVTTATPAPLEPPQIQQ